jgi:hypothetical protein
MVFPTLISIREVEIVDVVWRGVVAGSPDKLVVMRLCCGVGAALWEICEGSARVARIE